MIPEFMRGAVTGYRIIYSYSEAGRNDLGELEREIEEKVEIVGGVILEWKGESGETGKLWMDRQGLDTTKQYRLYALASCGIARGDDLEINKKVYRVGHVESYESHVEATVFEYDVAE